jgi:small subunit ribosomal protein S7
MARRNRAPLRPVLPDPRFQSRLVTSFTNKLMYSGKKSTAERIVNDALDRLEQVTGRSPIDVFEQAVRNATPVIEVKPRRVGGATYQVPVEVRPRRSNTLAIRWLVDFSRKRREKTMAQCLAGELMDAANGLGASIKRRDDMQKMAESNKAFAHYRW